MSFTLLGLRTLARQRADMENSSLVADAELTNYINASYAELYDLLTARYEDYFVKDPLTFSTSGTSIYPLPADFYKLLGVDLQLDSSNWVSIRKWNFAERNKGNEIIPNIMNRCIRYRVMGQNLRLLPENNADGTYRLWYIPRFAPLVADDGLLSGVLDFEEYIVLDSAIKMLVKEESDPSALLSLKAQMGERIVAMSANRDAGSPEVVGDVSYDDYDFLLPRG